MVLLRVTFAGSDVGTPRPVLPATPTAPPASDQAALNPGDWVAITEDGVRLRTEPSTDADVVAEFAAGAVLVVTGTPVAGSGGAWFPVTDETGDASGFVSEAFLAPED